MHRIVLAVALLVAASALARADDSFVVDSHAAIYLPETDEVSFYVRFNRQAPLPFAQLAFVVSDVDLIENTPRLWTTLRGQELSESGLVHLSTIDLVTAVRTDLGDFAYTFDGQSFQAVVPFGLLGVQSPEFHYMLAAGDNDIPYYQDVYGASAISVSEPSSAWLAIGAMPLLIAAGKRRKKHQR